MTLSISHNVPSPAPITLRGLWDIATPYVPGDVVQAGTSLYQAVTDTTGDDPATDDGTHWARVYEGA